MKTKPLIIKFQTPEDFATQSKKHLSKVLHSKGQNRFVPPHNELIWGSVAAYQKYMSDQKYTILATIYKHQPQSVYQLAKLLERAQPNVARDCKTLEAHGFITFEDSGDSRGGLVPQLAFDYNAIIVELSTVKYKVEF